MYLEKPVNPSCDGGSIIFRAVTLGKTHEPEVYQRFDRSAYRSTDTQRSSQRQCKLKSDDRQPL